jgi:spermidine synthase
MNLPSGLRIFAGGRLMVNRAAIAPLLILFFGGVNLILIQWVLVRELTTLLLGTELVILLVSVVYFLGLSLGYFLAPRIRREWLLPLGVATFMLHLTLPVWFRLLVTGLAAIGAYWVAFLVLPILTPLAVSSFYSLFLPRFVDGGGGSLPALYAVELTGSIAGVLALAVLGISGIISIYIVYSIGLLLLLWSLGASWRFIAILAALGAVWLLWFPNLNAWSNAQFFQRLQDLPTGTVTLFSGYSPYQKVDVLEAPGGGRYLYLDGLNHFGTPDGERLNEVMGDIPGALLKPQHALTVGAGSLEMSRMIAEHAGQVTTVELDPMVVDASRHYFTRWNWDDRLTNRAVVVDDAKHYLANTAERFDMVSTDTPAAFSMQTATLYSAPFFRLIAEHLNPHGVFVANLTSPFSQSNLVSRRITASLLTAFDHVMVVTPESVGWSFAYASNGPLPFSRAELETALRQSGETQFVIFDTPVVRLFVGDAQPITLDSMDIVLQTSADWIGSHLRWH